MWQDMSIRFSTVVERTSRTPRKQMQMIQILRFSVCSGIFCSWTQTISIDYYLKVSKILIFLTLFSFILLINIRINTWVVIYEYECLRGVWVTFCAKVLRSRMTQSREVRAKLRSSLTLHKFCLYYLLKVFHLLSVFKILYTEEISTGKSKFTI